MILWSNPAPLGHLRADQVDVSGDGLISGKTGCHLYFQIRPKDTEDARQAQFSATHCQVSRTAITSNVTDASLCCPSRLTGGFPPHPLLLTTQVTFEGPSKPDIRFRTGENNVVNCSWMAYLPGSYKIIIRYGGDEIAGSPFACSITESEKGLQILERQLAKINCTGAGLQFGLVNEPNEVRVNEVNGNCQFVLGSLVNTHRRTKLALKLRVSPVDLPKRRISAVRIVQSLNFKP